MRVICESCHHDVVLQGNECPRCKHRQNLSTFTKRNNNDGDEVLVPMIWLERYDRGDYTPPSTTPEPDFTPAAGEFGGAGASESFDSPDTADAPES